MNASNQQGAASGLTLRSLVLGVIQVLVVCLGAPYAIWVLGSSEITWSFFPIAVGFSFCCLILFNILLKTINPGWALRPAGDDYGCGHGLGDDRHPHLYDGLRAVDPHHALLLCLG